MVIMNFISEDANTVKYNYTPEDMGRPGIVELDKNTGEVFITELAEGDSIDGRLYKSKIAFALVGFHEKGEYPPRREIYWG